MSCYSHPVRKEMMINSKNMAEPFMIVKNPAHVVDLIANAVRELLSAIDVGRSTLGVRRFLNDDFIVSVQVQNIGNTAGSIHR